MKIMVAVVLVGPNHTAWNSPGRATQPHRCGVQSLGRSRLGEGSAEFGC